MEFDTRGLSPREMYQWMVASVVPRPIAWISTLSEEGVLNLAPYSFFTVASCDPPVLSVTQVQPRDRDAKDTLANLRATGECVVNIVSAELVDSMNASCADYPHDVSEFAALNIAAAPSKVVACAGVAAAKLRFECLLRELICVSSAPSGGTMMLLDVVHLHVDDGILVDGAIDPTRLDAVGKMGGDAYTHTRSRFALPRPVLMR